MISKELKEKNKKESINKALKKYKSNFTTLNFDLDKELVEKFRAKTKELGVKQLTVIESAILYFLEQE